MRTETEIKQEILEHKEAIFRKTKQLQELEASKKAAAAAWREKIKEVKESIDEELDAVEDCDREILDLKASILAGDMTPPPENG